MSGKRAEAPARNANSTPTSSSKNGKSARTDNRGKVKSENGNNTTPVSSSTPPSPTPSGMSRGTGTGHTSRVKLGEGRAGMSKRGAATAAATAGEQKTKDKVVAGRVVKKNISLNSSPVGRVNYVTPTKATSKTSGRGAAMIKAEVITDDDADAESDEDNEEEAVDILSGGGGYFHMNGTSVSTRGNNTTSNGLSYTSNPFYNRRSAPLAPATAASHQTAWTFPDVMGGDDDTMGLVGRGAGGDLFDGMDIGV